MSDRENREKFVIACEPIFLETLRGLGSSDDFVHALARSFVRAVTEVLGAGDGPDCLRKHWRSAIESEAEGIRDELRSVLDSRCDKIEGAI